MAAHTPSLIRLRGLSLSFQEGERTRTILENVDLDLEAGRCTVLLGPSGSGKSSLLNLLAGLEQPSSGEVWIGDTCLNRLSEKERTLFRRQHLGLVFQFFNLLPTLTLLENVILPLQLNHHPEAERLGREGLARVGLGDRLDSYPDRLSGGEQQRVALVRALINQPMLVLADEPTGNLDTQTGTQIADLLLDLVRQQRQTLVLVTHNPELAAQGDVVYTLHERRLQRQPHSLSA
ncbi:MAG: ABC transporter ATP-binding protein [Candidatus Sericytochromatia bacterium]